MLSSENKLNKGDECIGIYFYCTQKQGEKKSKSNKFSKAELNI